MESTLNEIRKLIEERRNSSPEISYVAKLFKKGRGKISQKVGEEATEVVIAALSETKEDLISESADLLFHLSMLWADCDISPDEVAGELQHRLGISGLDEKAARMAKE